MRPLELPVFDVGDNLDGEKLGEAAHALGAFRIRHPLFSASQCREALTSVRAFFDLPAEEKQQLAIERSPHFRGYSVMHNERDWREQIHLGREEQAHHGAIYEQLRGPNLWPDNAWKSAMLELIADLERTARDVLRALAASLGLPRERFLTEEEVAYLVIKLIHYQPLAESEHRTGVAPHVDFSWITLLLQDDTGGLEIRDADGAWFAVPPIPGTLVVNMGEIMQFATRGYYPAAPHRVINGARSRVSLPFFLNPALDTKVEPVDLAVSGDAVDAGTHVHRVFPTARQDAFIYGDEEWKRKGLNVYCGTCVASP
jgi:isopenicillin N synthase-like dioxygenase